MQKLMALYDGLNDSKDSINKDYTTFKTSIDIYNPETGECLFKGLKNKVIVPGSGLIARKLFDITTEEVTPSYNSIFGDAMYTPEADTPVTSVELNTKADKDNHKVLLFCVGTDGCGAENSQVYPVDYTKWIKPQDMVPFRYQLGSNDLPDEMRELIVVNISLIISRDLKVILFWFSSILMVHLLMEISMTLLRLILLKHILN